MPPKPSQLPPLRSAPSPPPTDDFEIDAEMDLSDQRAITQRASDLSWVKSVIIAPSVTARLSTASNKLRHPAHQFTVKGTVPLDHETAAKLYPSILGTAAARPHVSHKSDLSGSMEIDGETSTGGRGNGFALGIGSSSRDNKGDWRGEGDEGLDDGAGGNDSEDSENDGDEEDETNEEDGVTGLKEDERETEEARAKLSEADEELSRIKERLIAQGVPIPAPSSHYISPFVNAEAQAKRDGDTALAWKCHIAGDRDIELDGFLTSCAKKISPELLPEVRAASALTVKQFASLPAFRSNADQSVVTLVSPTRITSLCPCVILGQTTRVDGLVITHLESLLSYAFVSKGRIRRMFRRAVKRKGKFTASDILGLIGGVGPTSAADINNPRLYFVNFLDILGQVGMTHSLGLNRRTHEYLRTTYSPTSKLGIVQSFMKEQGLEWPGKAIALMWHDSKISLSDLPIPASALYAMETVCIVMSGSSLSDAQDIEDHLSTLQDPDTDQTPPTNRPDRPIMGTNTNISDIAGSFTGQGSLGIAGAVDLLRAIVAAVDSGVEFREYSAASDHSGDIAAEYLQLFHDVIPTTMSIKTLYQHIRLRSLVMRRAYKDLKEAGEMEGFEWSNLPGRDSEMWVKAKLRRVKGQGRTWM